MFHRCFPLYFWFLRLDVCHSPSVPGNSGRSSRKVSERLNFFVNRDEIETRITRMVTNLLTLELIGVGQFMRARLARRSLCAKAVEIRVVAPLQPKNQNLEAEDFWPTKHTNIHRNENV